jgi:hypothetical protein
MKTKYDICSGVTPRDLHTAVARMMEDGWLPAGGICFGPVNYEHPETGEEIPLAFHQAVTKTESIIKRSH